MDTQQKELINTLQMPEHRAMAEHHTMMSGNTLLVHFRLAATASVTATEILSTICLAALHNKKFNIEQKLMACNIIVQRAAAAASISNKTLVEVNALLQDTIMQHKKN